MPEGDAVRRTAKRLDAALAGEVLTRADLRVPRFATADLRGWRVERTAVAGKHLLTRLTGPSGRLTLHTHLRMEGRWATGPAGTRPVAGPGWQIRAWLVGSSSQAVGLRLGNVDLVRTADERQLVGHLGPDILADDFDAVRAAARVAQEGSRPLAGALLDQSVVSGLGTIWAAEAAFAAQASPWTPAAQVPRLADALAQCRTAMQRSVQAAGRRDAPAYRVYGRAGQPCRRCATPIRSGRVGEPPRDRVAYWCLGC